MLTVQLEFLTGRYGADHDGVGEWPPHPARLFFALTAEWGANPAEDPCAAERAALVALEQLGAPALAVSGAGRRAVVTHFVRPNDLTRVQVADVLAGHDQQLRRPRTFPSVLPDDPVVQFVWPGADLPASTVATLDGLCARVSRLGHSSSLVSVHVSTEPRTLTLVPGGRGTQLRVAGPGLLDALEDLHRRLPHQRGHLPTLYAEYGPPTADRPATSHGLYAAPAHTLTIVGVPDQNRRLHLDDTAALTRAIRAALMSCGPQPCPPVLSGHQACPTGGADDPTPALQGPHLAIVPLADVAHPHATGRVLGVALCLPHTSTEQDSHALLMALAGWRARGFALHLPRVGAFQVALADLDERRVTLTTTTWTRPSRTWASVTPIALDRYPRPAGSHPRGRLRRASRDASTSRRHWTHDPDAVAHAQDTIRRSCTRQGLPEPALVEILTQPAVTAAADSRRTPTYLSGGQRKELIHTLVVFDAPITGPLLLGAGRHFGIGLLRPVDDHR